MTPCRLPPFPLWNHLVWAIMGRLGLIVRLLVGALVNTLIVLALLASAAVVLLWIIGRNKQLQARRQQWYVGVYATGGDPLPSCLRAVGDWWP